MLPAPYIKLPLAIILANYKEYKSCKCGTLTFADSDICVCCGNYEVVHSIRKKKEDRFMTPEETKADLIKDKINFNIPLTEEYGIY